MNALPALFEATHERRGDYESLLFESEWHSSATLFERSTRVAAGLRDLGVGPGDRVVVLMMNTPEVFVTYQAVWRAGAVVTPVVFLQTPPELRHILTDSGATVAVITPELLGLVQAAATGLDLRVVVVGGTHPGTVEFAALEAGDPLPVQDRADDDLAALLYTGGTTGRAKGVMLTHRGLGGIAAGLAESTREMATDRSLLPLPLSHAYGLIVFVAGQHREGRPVAALQRWFDATGWLELVAAHRLQSSPIVPTMLAQLLALPVESYDLTSLVSLGSGGAPLSAALRSEAEKRLGVTVLEGYGCTEASAVVSAQPAGAARPGSVGKPLPHVTVTIRDPAGAPVAAGQDGEVCVGGPGVMAGYWNDPDQTALAVVDGELRTGDVGHLDADGYLYIVDRQKDLIIRGGFNVFPRDVEDVLMEHPDVASAAVVGRPDADHGEEVVAVVSLRPGSAATADELIAHARDRLARYKYPREIRLVDAVPVTSVGKTDRKAVRAMVRRASP